MSSMKRIRNLAAMVGAASICVSGLTIAADEMDIGKQDYDANCAVCHGLAGKGDGPYAAKLKLPMPDLTVLAKNNGGVFPSARVFNLIDGRDEVQGHGPRDMPVWGEDYLAKAPRGESVLNREGYVRGRILTLIDYMNRLQAK
jgi:mono/diheme cytochrome c family protein